MVTLSTIVQIPRIGWQIDHTSKCLLLGSCFADEIGSLMAHHGFDVVVNPLGALYNPLSIANALDATQPVTMVQHNGLWHSLQHHSRFSGEDYDRTLEECVAANQALHRRLEEADTIIITFGSAYVYERAGQVVANCHKLPEGEFRRRRLTVDEIVKRWRAILRHYEDKRWLFTVSPIRHLRDGLHENELSKATLLLAIDELGADYFPAYEILLDELRDYRYYGEDLTHPSKTAVEIIWERFEQTFMSPQTINGAHLRYKDYLRTQHRIIVQQ